MSTAFVLPTQDSIFNQIRTAMPGLKFYKWGQEWYEFSHAGNVYHIPPDLPGQPNIVNPYAKRDAQGRFLPGEALSKADGTIEIRGRFGTYIPHVENVAVSVANRIYGQLPGEQTEHIATYIMTSHSSRGVLMLTGDPRRDEQIKAESRKLVVSARRADDEQQVSAFAARKDAWERHPQKATIQPPRPSKKQREAQVRLDALKEAGEAIGKYICPHLCAVETNDWEEFAQHMNVAHGITVVRPNDLVVVEPQPAIDSAAASAAVASLGASALSHGGNDGAIGAASTGGRPKPR